MHVTSSKCLHGLKCIRSLPVTSLLSFFSYRLAACPDITTCHAICGRVLTEFQPLFQIHLTRGSESLVWRVVHSSNSWPELAVNKRSSQAAISRIAEKVHRLRLKGRSSGFCGGCFVWTVAGSRWNTPHPILPHPVLHHPTVIKT